MGAKRPWKMRFHYDGTKNFENVDSSEDYAPESAYTIDTSRPINGTSSHPYRDAADGAARQVSRNGGTAKIIYKDPETGIETEVRAYAPYEVAMEELTAEIDAEHPGP